MIGLGIGIGLVIGIPIGAVGWRWLKQGPAIKHMKEEFLEAARGKTGELAEEIKKVADKF